MPNLLGNPTKKELKKELDLARKYNDLLKERLHSIAQTANDLWLTAMKASLDAFNEVYGNGC